MKHHAMLRRIHLELARTQSYPEGSADHGYEFVAPLTGEGHVDLESWRENKKACTVTRFWGDAPEQHGHLAHVRGGWHFAYGEDGTENGEPFYKLDRHTFTPGAYVTITEPDGKPYPFKVLSIVPVID